MFNCTGCGKTSKPTEKMNLRPGAMRPQVPLHPTNSKRRRTPNSFKDIVYEDRLCTACEIKAQKTEASLA
jgi:hypothetical protein